jgi:hypothetical protein
LLPAGLINMEPQLMAPHYTLHQQNTFSIAITSFHYEGFRIITHTAEDIVNRRTRIYLEQFTFQLLLQWCYILHWRLLFLA